MGSNDDEDPPCFCSGPAGTPAALSEVSTGNLPLDSIICSAIVAAAPRRHVKGNVGSGHY